MELFSILLSSKELFFTSSILTTGRRMVNEIQSKKKARSYGRYFDKESTISSNILAAFSHALKFTMDVNEERSIRKRGTCNGKLKIDQSFISSTLDEFLKKVERFEGRFRVARSRSPPEFDQRQDVTNRRIGVPNRKKEDNGAMRWKRNNKRNNAQKPPQQNQNQQAC